MRDCFASTVTRLAEKDERIVLLSGDVGNRMFDKFKAVAPDRFYNCGIAEAAMMSIAAGLALEGYRPVVYTIAPFTTTRCLEQIKIGAAYHRLPITFVGTGSGLSYAELGPTHYSFEDIAILKSIPDINILAPADSCELAAQLEAAIYGNKPSYIRIGKKGEPVLHRDGSSLGIGKANILKEGDDCLIIGIGPILGEALEAAIKAERLGISIAVASAGSVKPLDQEFLYEMKKRFSCWFSIEEHSVIGGLGTSILEWLNYQEEIPRLEILGIPDRFIHKLGKQGYIRNSIGLDSDGILERIKRLSSQP